MIDFCLLVLYFVDGLWSHRNGYIGVMPSVRRFRGFQELRWWGTLLHFSFFSVLFGLWLWWVEGYPGQGGQWGEIYILVGMSHTLVLQLRFASGRNLYMLFYQTDESTMNEGFLIRYDVRCCKKSCKNSKVIGVHLCKHIGSVSSDDLALELFNSLVDRYYSPFAASGLTVQYKLTTLASTVASMWRFKVGFWNKSRVDSIMRRISTCVDLTTSVFTRN